MFNGLLLYFLFLVGSHVILNFLVYLLYFFFFAAGSAFYL